MTREEARLYFEARGLTYRDISPADLELLRSLLDRQFAQERRERLQASKPVYWQRVNAVYGDNQAEGGMIWTRITAKGSAFTSTNVISFNRDGFIGFCGEASDEHLQPVLVAFVAWCDELAAMKEIGKEAGDDGGS